jgi:hypothetical protein
MTDPTDPMFRPIFRDPVDPSEAYIVELEAILEAVNRALDGESVSDFMASFPVVRKAITIFNLMGE